jgi:hypothetical protein
MDGLNPGSISEATSRTLPFSLGRQERCSEGAISCKRGPRPNLTKSVLWLSKSWNSATGNLGPWIMLCT